MKRGLKSITVFSVAMKLEIVKARCVTMFNMSLKTLRRRLRLTQAEAAKLCGVASNTWARWERKELTPDSRSKKLIDMLPTLYKTESPRRRGD